MTPLGWLGRKTSTQTNTELWASKWSFGGGYLGVVTLFCWLISWSVCLILWHKLFVQFLLDFHEILQKLAARWVAVYLHHAKSFLVICWQQSQSDQGLYCLLKESLDTIDVTTESKCPGPEVIKLFSCSTQLSMKISLLINMKMPTIVGIFIFISRENFMLSKVKQERICSC